MSTTPAQAHTDCTPQQLSDTTDKERIHKCSSVSSCYDFGAHTYSNDKCGTTESCGTWRKKGDVLLQGCIRSDFCDTDAEYEGHPTTYKCPQGPKALSKTPSDTPSSVPTSPTDAPVSPGSAAAAGPDALGRTPLIEFWGYTDLDIVDGVAGLFGGMMATDEKTHFSQCYGGIPQIVEQFKVEFESIDWKDLLNWSKDWEEIQTSWGFFQNILKEIPNEINMCTSIVTDLIAWIIGLVGTLQFGLLWTNLQTGAMTIMMNVMAKGTDIGVAFAGHDFYRLGQDVGQIINSIIALGLPPNTA